MRIGSLFGVPVKVNLGFTLLLLALSLLGLLPQALVLFGSVLIHELVHAIVARGYGLTPTEIELLPFGGVARITDLGGLDPVAEKGVALAGPVASLLMAGFFWALQNNWPLYPELITLSIYGNLALGLLNLLPAMPLDGGRVLRAFLAGRLGYRRATRTALVISKILALLIFLGGLALAWLGRLNISLPVVGVFLWVAAGKEEYSSRYLFMQYLTRRREELDNKAPHQMESLLCDEKMPVKDVIRHFLPQRYHLVYLMDGEKDLLGYVTELEVIEAMLNNGIDTPLAALPIHTMGRE